MAIKYRVYKNPNSKSEYYNKCYGRAVILETVNTDQLASIIEANCTVKRSDILAVLSELVVTMKAQLQDSKRVKLDRFGSFKIGMSTKPADEEDKFDERKNIKGFHVLFQPELRIDKNGNRSKSLLDGIEVMKMPKFDGKKATAQNGEQQNP